MRKGETKRGNKVRVRLTERFLEDLQLVYNETGIGAIRTMRQEDPTKFCLMIAGLLPREMSIDVSENRLNELSDDQINELIERVQQIIGGRLAEAEIGSRDGEEPTLQ